MRIFNSSLSFLIEAFLSNGKNRWKSRNFSKKPIEYRKKGGESQENMGNGGVRGGGVGG
jgi:hypothetical protein